MSDQEKQEKIKDLKNGHFSQRNTQTWKNVEKAKEGVKKSEEKKHD